MDSESGLSEEFIERSIENKIQNYEQAVKIIEQQKELVESLKKQLTIEQTNHEKTKWELDLKNSVSPKRQKELQKKVNTLAERSVKDNEELNSLRSKIKNLETTAEPNAKPNIEKDNTPTLLRICSPN